MGGRMVACLMVMCAGLFLVCYLGTGGDTRNIRNLNSYPDAVRNAALQDSRLAAMVPGRQSGVMTFVSNLVAFTLALLVVRLVARPEGFVETFVALLAVGEGLNLFDLVVIDLLWWRSSPRVRISGIDDPALYRDPRPHAKSFLRGIPMFALAALLASIV